MFSSLTGSLSLPPRRSTTAKRTTETKRRRHNKQDGLHAGKNRVVYSPIISRRGRSCMAIDIKDIRAFTSSEANGAVEAAPSIDRRSCNEHKEVLNVKFISANGR